MIDIVIDGRFWRLREQESVKSTEKSYRARFRHRSICVGLTWLLARSNKLSSAWDQKPSTQKEDHRAHSLYMKLFNALPKFNLDAFEWTP